ncbi:unnamed protein product [Durusdinium trenchii]|uniref:Uncharacterized protein n=1 Tax=Durusdinium trenchii TaxID=1381693 RepID=A0ABP0T2L3_9DINO
MPIQHLPCSRPGSAWRMERMGPVADLHKAWVNLIQMDGKPPWRWTSGYRWLCWDFDQQVLYYTLTSSGHAMCQPVLFREIQPAMVDKDQHGPKRRASAAWAVCRPEFRVTLELRAWSATLVVLDAAEQRRCQQLLAAAAGRSERLGRSTSNCSTTASSASLHEIGCAPARCSAPEVGSGGFGRPSLQRDSREHHVKWTSFTKACGMTADERKHADLLLIHSKVWSTCRTRRAAGEASVMQMSPEEMTAA